MRPRTRARIGLGAVVGLATLVVAMFLARPTPAIAQADIDHLGGSQQRMDDRMQLLRDEFKERQHELREARERAHKKHARGKKVEQIPADSDQLPANLRAGNFALPMGVNQATLIPTNTMANNKTGDATGASAAGQAEQSIAFLGQNGLAAWNDGQGFNLTPQDVQGYGYTTNGGATWTDGGIPVKGGTIATWTSDPVVTVNEKTGEFYYVGLTSNTGTNNNGLAVARGHFSGASFVWDGVSQVSAGPSASQGYDKQWMCADSLTGNVYCTWTIFTTTGDDIWFSRSTDGGVTWSAKLQVSGSWETGLCSGSRPGVGPNGEVYVQYSAFGAVDADSIKILKSTNAGTSFGPSVVAGTVMDNYFTGAPGFNRGRAVTFPAMAIDRSTGPNRGRVYLTIQNSVNFYGDTFPALTNANYVPEIENNGNFKNATPFTVGKNLRGAIATSDIDNWKFPATAGTTYFFYCDSVRTSTFKYTMRLYCPNDTTVLSRLAMSSDGSSSSSVNVHASIVWTCPASGTYYLRMQYSTSTGGYRIRTMTHTPVGSDIGRDTRDVTVISSADGVTGWSAPVRMNDDAALYDNWLPEVAVAQDGKVYGMWFDWRDTPASCFGGSNIYLTRSEDGGATWAANQVVTNVATSNWTQVASNIAPNQGDYNGMYGGDCIGLAWADGRLGDSDVWTAHLTTGYTLTNCPGDQVVTAGTSLNTGVTINNLNQMFGNTYNYAIAVDHAWAGYPAGGTLGVGLAASGVVPVTITVPDTAADGEVVRVCVTTSINGAAVQTCCFNLTVSNLSTPTLASLASSTAEPGRISLSWLVDSRSPVNVYRSTDGTSWSLLSTMVPNSQGYVLVEDTNVAGGSSYSYRLGITAGGRELYAGQTTIAVPVAAEFALSRVFPSPASAGFSVNFALPSNAPATLEVIDLAGRRVFSRQVGMMGAGRHTLSLQTETGRLPIGVYAVRLSQGGKVATSKVSVLR